MFDPESLTLDLPVMMIAAIALAAFVLTRKNIGRVPGLIFTGAYIGFILMLAENAGAF